MAWQMFRVTYELLSPLHIGYHKVANVQRTRYYIPARNLWGAVTERLTRSGFETAGVPRGDYQKIGEWVKEHCAFSYFYLCEEKRLLHPHWTKEGLRYGSLAPTEFERRWLSVHVATALDASTTSAEIGSLHEVEFIAPYQISGPRKAQRTRLGGWVFLDTAGLQVLGDLDRWSQWLKELQVGGERRYGFGRLKLSQDNWAVTQEMLPGYTVHLEGKRPQVTVEGFNPVLAHVPTEDVQGRGMIEPLVGRETDSSKSHAFGRRLTRGVMCWAPGTVLETAVRFEIIPEGVWSPVAP